MPDTWDADDLLILSQELAGRRPWLEKNDVVGLRLCHILRAALATGRTPADITARLAASGTSDWPKNVQRKPRRDRAPG